MQEIEAAWTSVREAVPDHVTVVAVSKTKPVEAVVAAHAAGARVFGENRVQELVGKHEALTHPDAPNHSDYADLHWHQIGTLQRNKVKYIAPFVSLIHAVDQVALLDEIDKRAAVAGRRIPVLLQVHIAEEQTKFGFGANDLPPVCDRLDADGWAHVEVKGLMGMATFSPDAAQVDGNSRACAVSSNARCRPRVGHAVHGHERRLADRRGGRQHHGPHRECDFRSR